MKLLFIATSLCVLAGCSSGGNAASPPIADISKVIDAKSTFGPEFTVKDMAKRPIDPMLFSAHKLPPDAKFDPAACAEFAAGSVMPLGMQGSMAAVSAEGDGNRFLVIAVETSHQLPVDDLAPNCTKVTFAEPRSQGSIQVVDTPKIEGTKTSGTHHVVQMLNRAGPPVELYRYSAQFGHYEVIVTASPQQVPGQPIAPLVDTQRACDLLVKVVAAIQS